jgi:hypothetical protein
MSKKITNDIPTLKCKRISNKIGQGIVISKALVLIEYGMNISSHCNAKSYAK